MTLEQLLRMKVRTRMAVTQEEVGPEFSPEFRIAVQEEDDERGVRVIVHATGYDSDTQDYWVKGNTLGPI